MSIDQDRAEMAAIINSYMEERGEFGTLTDYRTGTPIRPATREEWERCIATPLHAFMVETETEAFMATVDGGPEGVTPYDRR